MRAEECIYASVYTLRRTSTHARGWIVTHGTYTGCVWPVIHGYRLAVAAFVLLQEVYRITPPPTPPAPAHGATARSERTRDKLTDDWYLMKICLPAGREIRDESGDELADARCIKEDDAFAERRHHIAASCVQRGFCIRETSNTRFTCEIIGKKEKKKRKREEARAARA